MKVQILGMAAAPHGAVQFQVTVAEVMFDVRLYPDGKMNYRATLPWTEESKGSQFQLREHLDAIRARVFPIADLFREGETDEN